MSKTYRHLTHPDRCQIYALKKSGFSHHAIARQPSRDPRTIGREVARGHRCSWVSSGASP